MALLRYIHPSSTSFVDPAIVTFIPKTQPLSSHLDRYEEDEETTTTSIASSPIITQRSSPPQPTASTSLDHLWSKQEKYDNLELRLFALEESEKRFEDRLDVLEKKQNETRLLQQAMKPDELPAGQQDSYIKLYHSLLEKYNTLQKELEAKEKLIQDLLTRNNNNNNTKKIVVEQQQKPCYKEEDGYLLFDTTNMNGEITQCRVKIPMSFKHHQPPPPPPTRFTTRIRPQQQFYTTTTTSSSSFLKNTLNPNAPEWNKKDNNKRLFY